jgi:mannose-1-phosphate guanylyltransferase / phosphomannomutase
MKAVVMAGGAGTRLRPLTMSTPKPLLPVVGRLMVEHLLRLLRRHGIDEALVTVHYLAPTVRSQLGDGTELGVNLSYVTEPRPVGTAGSVKLAEEMLTDGAFLVVSGDGLTDIDLTELIDFHRRKEALVTVCLSRRESPLGLGIVVTDESGRVVRFLEKPGWGQVFTNAVNTGIYVVEPEVLAHIPADADVDWSADVFPALLAAGYPIFGYIAEGYWEDVGTIEAYRQVQVDVLNGLVDIDIPGHEIAPGIWIGQGVEIDPDAELEAPVVLGDNVQVGAGARVGAYSALGRNTIVDAGAQVERAVTLANVYIGTDARLRGCVIGRGSEILDRAQVDEGSSVADDCRVGPEAVVTNGADVFPQKVIDAGARVSDSVVWEFQAARIPFGRGGLSGTVNLDITAEGVAKLAAAYATLLPKKVKVALARDHSQLSQPTASVLAGALAAAGMDVAVLDIAPTPILRAHTAWHCDGGVMVRTVPGKPEMIKVQLLDASGGDLGFRNRQNMERILDRHDVRRASPGEVGTISGTMGAINEYVAHVIAHTDITGIADADLRIVVDTTGGTAAIVLPELMAGIDVDVLAVNMRLTPTHATETPEEAAEALRRLSLMVTSSRAALGVRIDPTGERLSIIDETGRVLTDDRALLVVLDLIAAEHREGVAALPVTTTRVAEQVANFHETAILWTPTGSGAVAAVAGREDIFLAGDADGGFVDPAVGESPDAMAALIRILGLVARTRLTLRQIDTRIPQTTLLRESVAVPWASKAAVMAAVRENAQGLPLDEIEGVRIVLSDSEWVLIAPDPDEAAVRMWVEAAEPGRAGALADHWRQIIFNCAAH